MITARLLNRITDEPITLQRVKDHLVVGHSDDDDIIGLYRDAAIEHIENETRRTLPLSRYRVKVNEFEDVITLNVPPVRAISNITYYDCDDVQQSILINDCNVNTDYEWATIEHKTGWPDGSKIELEVVAGYGYYTDDPEGFPYTLPIVLGSVLGEEYPLPRPIELSALLLAAHWYENREATVGMSLNNIPLGVTTLLFKYRNYKS